MCIRDSTYIGAFSDKNAGTSKTVTITPSYTGADVGNYSVTDHSTVTANITAKALTVSGITASDKTYDATTSATLGTGSISYGGLVSGDTLTGTYSGVFDNANVAAGKTVTITSSYGGADVNNYTITDQASTTADVTAKALTVSGITASNKTYDGNTVATLNTGGVTYTGLVGGDVFNGTYTGAFSDKNVGTGKTVTITPSYTGADVSNYSVTDHSTVTANITAKALTVSGITALDKG